MLRTQGVPDILVNVIAALYENRRAIIRLGVVATNHLDYNHGIILVTLSPLLFVIFAIAMSLEINELKLEDDPADHLSFMDDFGLFASRRQHKECWTWLMKLQQNWV